MAVVTVEELQRRFNEIVGDNTSDEVISFLEDLSDTLSASSADEVERLTRECQRIDEEWRKKYRDRFLGGDEPFDNVSVTVVVNDENATERKYEDLFKFE